MDETLTVTTAPPEFLPTPRASLAALLAFALALPVYLWGAAPTVLSGDSAELQAVALQGGVPHPTGYPTFVLLGRVFARLLPGDPAHRITQMCAGFGAVSVALFALVLAELGISWAMLLAGALLYASTYTLWWASLRTEVYTIGIVLFLFALWRVLVARRTLRPRDGLLAAFAIGCAMTGHLSFAPALALLGLGLIVSGWQAGVLRPPIALGALAALVLGLTPYFYLLHADARTTDTNYLRYTIEASAGQFGYTLRTFETPLARLAFLIGGVQSHPRDYFEHPRLYAMNLLDAGLHFALFELGPLTLALALFGRRVLGRRDAGAAWRLGAIPVVTLAAGALVVDGGLLIVFLMAATIACVALAAVALDSVRARAPTMAALLWLAALALPHALRVRADAGPLLGAMRLRVEEEGPPHITTFVPQMRGERTSRALAERMFAAIPESSFVAARWELVMTMKYLRQVEGVRRDLTLDTYYHPWHLARIERWQRTHDLSRSPVVTLGDLPVLRARFAAPESLAISGGPALWIERRRVDTRLP